MGRELRIAGHEGGLGQIVVALRRRQLLPVRQGVDDHLVELLPLLLVVASVVVKR